MEPKGVGQNKAKMPKKTTPDISGAVFYFGSSYSNRSSILQFST